MNMSSFLKNIYINKLIKTGIIVFFPIVMLMILGPIEVYYSNITDFSRILSLFFYIMDLTLIISLLPDKLMCGIDAFIYDFSIIAYIQNMFLNTKITGVDRTEVN